MQEIGEQDKLLKYLGRPGRSGTLFSLLLLSIILVAMLAWIQQVQSGLGVTGLNRPVYWGVYMANFVFFISISMAGTFISAVMRLLNLDWGKPITRIAEVITVGSLVTAALNILFDVGQLNRALLYIPLFGRIQSPVGWDVIVLLFYLLTGLGYLHVALIPDVALLSTRESRFKRIYELLRYDWTGEEKQVSFLHFAVKVLAIITVPVALLMHTVTGWIFGGMKAVPTWNDAVMGPYFIMGALLSGLSLVVIIAAVVRKTYQLREFLPDETFSRLGKILAVFCLGYLYFFLAETFTVRYASLSEDMQVSQLVWFGNYSPVTIYVAGSLIVSSAILLTPRLRNYIGVTVVSALLLPAMWIKRILIVTPGLESSLRLPTVQMGSIGYAPTFTEAALTMGSFALLGLMIFFFTKLFPCVPLWEIRGVVKVELDTTPFITLKKVFTGWLAGITVSSIFTLAWVVLTLFLAGAQSGYIYSVRVGLLEAPVVRFPGPVTSTMATLLFVVAFAGLVALAGRRERESY